MPRGEIVAKQADGQRITREPLSSIINDARTRAAFQRGERDEGPGPLATVIASPKPTRPLVGAEMVEA
jgi:hypothetical protein